MNDALSKIKARLSFTEILCLIFFISLICALRAVTSICTGLLLVAGIAGYKPAHNFRFSKNPGNTFAAGCIFFFLLQISSLFYTHDIYESWNDIRLKSGLVFLPLAILFTGYLTKEKVKNLLLYYCLFISAASFFLLCMALSVYLQSHKISSFFYYELIKPFAYHPVYYSLLVFAALLFLMENFSSRETAFTKALSIPAVIFLSGFLLLLSSKLVISFYLFYVIYFLLTQTKKNKTVRLVTYISVLLIILLSATVLLTQNPLGNRFRDMVHGNINLVKQEHFSPAVYFNGIQFRLLQWKFVPEILNEKHCWWTGVTAGDAQTILNAKYLSKGMYSGAPGQAGQGYLGYNTHSQILESLLQNGIPGLIAFMLISISLIRIIWQLKKRLVSFTIILLLVYSSVESLFQEQYGIVIFTFLPLFISQEYAGKN